MGNAVVHWELWSKDPQGASDFCAQVFGWQVRHIPGMDYPMVDTGA